MSHPYAGQMAKTLTAKKRPRYVWNLFFCGLIGLILLMYLVFVYGVLCDHITSDHVQIYLDHDENRLVTDQGGFEFADFHNQKIAFSMFSNSISEGEKIILTISDINDELLTVKYKGEVVYQVQLAPVLPTVIASIVLILPMLIFCIVMLIIINIKHPSKKVDRFRSKFLLRIHK